MNMMKFRTEIRLPRAMDAIDHRSRILMIGSCFSDHISERLGRSGFDVLANPHGILFNPVSIKNAIDDYLSGRKYTIEDLVSTGENWVSLGHHGRFSHRDPETILERINAGIKGTRHFLEKSSHLIITLGTSWVYRHRDKGRIVANCHKIPQSEFTKELLTSEQISAELSGMISKVRQVNASVEVILTVSPVRHLKDGMIQNTLSKARLHEAVHELTKAERTHYFPSYEIMMDDLRDYRFYEKDLIHPNETAVDYIWEKFSDTWINPSCRDLMKKVEKVLRALEHRPLDPSSEETLKFRQSIDKEIEALQKAHPEIRFTKKGSP